MIEHNTAYPTILEKFYQYEKEQPQKLFLSEPIQGVAQQHTWQQAGQQIRKMAAALLQLQSLFTYMPGVLNLATNSNFESIAKALLAIRDEW